LPREQSGALRVRERAPHEDLQRVGEVLQLLACREPSFAEDRVDDRGPLPPHLPANGVGIRIAVEHLHMRETDEVSVSV